MLIRHLRIERFRGIKFLDWQLGEEVICLVGPGDSTKSTIVEALELTLSSRWDYAFDDTDFYDGVADSPILVTATVGQLPDALLADSKFGLDIRGWNPRNGLSDEPGDTDEPVLSVRLRVDSSLEPQWIIINDRNPEGRHISSRDRQMLGVLRLSPFIDRHLTWNDGTVLSRLTEDRGSFRGILAEVGRAARATISGSALPALTAAAIKAQELAKAHGVAPRTAYRPGLDVQRANLRQGGMALHDGNVPLRRAGLGTKRLLTFALQREVARDGGITLVDEVEHGLEPHRIRYLVRTLRPEQGRGQVIMTTHSPVVVQEMNASSLRIVRSASGTTTVTSVSPSLQGVVRAASEALLGRRIIVCEGKTEVGLCRAFDEFWSEEQNKEAFAYLGVVPVDGGGSNASQRAIDIRQLGYAVCFLGDSDRPLAPDPAEMQTHGIHVLLWADSKCLEERIAFDLPWEGICDLVNLAIEDRGVESVLATIAGQLEGSPASMCPDVTTWRDSILLRAAVGRSAKQGSWFKRISTGEKLGKVVCKHIARMGEKDVTQKMTDIRQWVDACD